MASTVYANNNTKVSEAVYLIDIFVIQRQIFIFTYS